MHPLYISILTKFNIRSSDNEKIEEIKTKLKRNSGQREMLQDDELRRNIFQKIYSQPTGHFAILGL